MHRAQVVTGLLYESDYLSIRAADVLLALRGDQRLRVVPRAELLETPVVKLAAAHGLVNSNGTFFISGPPIPPEGDLTHVAGAARDLVKGKGLYVNDQVVSDSRLTIAAGDLLDGRFVILGAGTKKRIVLITVEE